MKKAILAVALFGASLANADINKVANDFTACANEAESTAEQNECADKAYTAADKELNRVYKSILSQFTKETDANSKEIVSRLVNSQRAWVKFRDLNCQLVGTQMLGGSGEGPLVGGCFASSTIDRVRELQSIFAEN